MQFPIVPEHWRTLEDMSLVRLSSLCREIDYSLKTNTSDEFTAACLRTGRAETNKGATSATQAMENRMAEDFLGRRIENEMLRLE